MSREVEVRETKFSRDDPDISVLLRYTEEDRPCTACWKAWHCIFHVGRATEKSRATVVKSHTTRGSASTGPSARSTGERLMSIGQGGYRDGPFRVRGWWNGHLLQHAACGEEAESGERELKVSQMGLSLCHSVRSSNSPGAYLSIHIERATPKMKSKIRKIQP